MKKYLMTGIAAVAISAAFTSCSKETNLYNPDEIAQNEFEAKATKYKEAFVNAFGQPAANQDWGFGSYSNAARTRASINVNGNLWESCPSVASNEPTLVFNYVNMTRPQMTAAGHKYTEVAPDGLTDYFVTQVYTGTDTYKSIDGTVTGIVGSSHMDNLHIAMQSSATLTNGSLVGDWEHINNFNRGDDTDWDGNTLVNDGGTFDFAFNSSLDANYHNKWIAVDGADIDASLAGYYYICFDFVADNSEAYTAISNYKWYNPYNVNADKWENGGNFTISGYYTADMLTSSNITVTHEVEVWNEETQTIDKYTVTSHFNNPDEIKDIQISNLVGGNKIFEANDIYTDWIIRLVKATPKEEEKTVVRVIAEDMAGYTADDFDFNDVVFDCELDENEYVTKITLVHTGAEFSITVDGVEVHSAFGLPKNANRPQYWTMGSGNYSFTPKSTTYKVADIPVIATQIVEVKGEDGEIEYKTKDITLEAPKGLTTGKLAVGRDFGIIPERQSIDTYTNGKFSEYVKNSGVWNQWYK